MRTEVRGPCIRPQRSALLALALLLLLGAGSAAAQRLVDSRESLYNNIFIYRDGTYVTMTFGHNKRIYTESRMNLADRTQLPVRYTQFMTAALIYAPAVRAAAMIGLGGGRTSQYLHQFVPEVEVDVVELDPAVVELARAHFRLREDDRYRIHTQDGRLYLRRAKRRFDLILIDAYRGPFVPFHLMTREFYELAKQRLQPRGVVAQNVEPTTMLFDSAVATMRSVFEQVDMYPAGGNVVLVAYDGARRNDAELLRAAQVRQQRYGFPYPLPELFAARRRLVSPLEGQVLTDDFAPANMLKAIEHRNRKWE